jgi:transcriptional regulator with XRE-family HTH domain
MTNDVTDFDVLPRACRRAVGLSQEELAGRAALSTHAISGLECGRAGCPRRQSVCRLANALDLRDQIRTAEGTPQRSHIRQPVQQSVARSSVSRRAGFRR